MHHECPCADKLERHPHGGVADTPGTTRSAIAVPGAQLEQAIAAITARILESDVSCLPEARWIVAQAKAARAR